jgi:hypothetical protein
LAAEASDLSPARRKKNCADSSSRLEQSHPMAEKPRQSSAISQAEINPEPGGSGVNVGFPPLYQVRGPEQALIAEDFRRGAFRDDSTLAKHKRAGRDCAQEIEVMTGHYRGNCELCQ